MVRIACVLSAFGLASSVVSAGAVTVLSEDFESTSGFTTSTPFFSDGSGDYFGIDGGAADTLSGTTGLKSYTGFSGGFLTGQDLDGEGASLPITVTWANLDITNLTDLSFSGAFAEFFDAPGDIDTSDSLIVEYEIDGGGFQTLLNFSGDDPDGFNGNFIEMTGGETLGNAAQTISRAIAGTGSVLDLRLSIDLNSADEDFAVDDFTITGRVIPLPAPAAMGFASLAGLGLVTRRRSL